MKASDIIALVAAIASAAAVVVSIVSFVSNRKYTRDQIRASQAQFASQSIPKVVVMVSIDKDKQCVCLQGSNEHQTVTVRDFTVDLTGKSPAGDIFAFRFPDLSRELTPKGTIEASSSVTVADIRSVYGDGSEMYIRMDSRPVWPVNEKVFPLSLTYSYLPNQDGASKVDEVREAYLVIKG